ncbi:MAG TPA: hypothetical protein PLM16_01115 [Candidatus Woesebacteria bacterium]|nr:hypothetical protein [Candidatus Woesebacteria bacterium]
MLRLITKTLASLAPLYRQFVWRPTIIRPWSKVFTNLTTCTIITVSLGFLFGDVLASPIIALPPPVDKEVRVSATMPDIVPPSVPVLIAPADGSMVNTNRPQFVWHESTDNVLMSHYQFFINGELVLDNLEEIGSFPLYRLSYDSELGYYYLDIKFDLGQGINTWKIVAVDAVGLPTDSATWSFFVDSIAPHFVVTKLGELELSISSQDPNTLPDEPLRLDANQPQIVARGETLSTVQLTVLIPGRESLYIETEIDARGNWTYTLPILPRDQVITLNFVIIDPARHVSVLEGIKFIIPSAVIILPIGPATSPPAGIILSPTTSPEDETLGIIPSPTIQTPIEGPHYIPYLPPKEMLYQAWQFLTPTPLLKITQQSWFLMFINQIGPWWASLILFSPLIIATVWLLRRMEGAWSWYKIGQCWRILGIVPMTHHQGWAFDNDYYRTQTKELLGVPFAKVVAISQSEPEGYPPYYQTTLTNRLGLYPSWRLPLKNYKLAVIHPDYRYPASLKRQHPNYVDYYQADLITLSLKKDQLSLQIPLDNDANIQNQLDPKTHTKKEYCQRNWSKNTRRLLNLSKLAGFEHWLVWPQLIISLMITTFWPSFFNLFATALFLVWAGSIRWGAPWWQNVTGLVVDQDGQPVQDVLVRFIEQEEKDINSANQTGSSDQPRLTTIDTNLVRATVSDQEGRFRLFLGKGDYVVEASRPDHLEPSGIDLKQQLEVKKAFEQHQLVVGIKLPY